MRHTKTITARAFLDRKDPLVLLERDGPRAFAELERYLLDEEWVFDWCDYVQAVAAGAKRTDQSETPADLPAVTPDELADVVQKVVFSPVGLSELGQRGAITPEQLMSLFLQPHALLQVHGELRHAGNRYWRRLAKTVRAHQSSKAKPRRIARLDRSATVFQRAAAYLRITAPLWRAGGTALLSAAACLLLITYLGWPQPVAPSAKVPPQDQWLPLGSSTPAGQRPLKPVLPPGWRRGALVVGVGDYRDSAIQQLTTARARANEVGRWAKGYFGADPANIVSLLDEGATEVSVRAAITYFRQFSTPNDTILLYFVCHGVPDVKNKLRLQVYDSSADGGVPLEELLDLLGDTKAQVVVVADVCYAGLASADVPKDKAVWMLLSSRDQELSFENASTGRTNFSSTWLEAASGMADANGDGLVTLEEAFTWTVTRMEQENFSHHPQLISPQGGNPSNVFLSVYPPWRDKLAPDRGVCPAAPALVALTLLETPGYRDVFKLSMDGQELGCLRQPRELLRVRDGAHRLDVRREVLRLPEGTHRLEVSRSTPLWAETEDQTPARWTSTVAAKAGVNTEEQLVRLPSRGTVVRLRVVGQAKSGLFQQLVRSPATDAVRVEPGEGTLRFEFSPQDGAQGLLSACYIGDPNQGVNVASLLGVPADGTVLLAFDARSESPAVAATFFVGGVGGDSLTPAKSLHVPLPENAWKRFELTLPASRLDHLVNGFGVEVDAANTPGRSVVIHVRDVTMTAQRKSR